MLKTVFTGPEQVREILAELSKYNNSEDNKSFYMGQIGTKLRKLERDLEGLAKQNGWETRG